MSVLAASHGFSQFTQKIIQSSIQLLEGLRRHARNPCVDNRKCPAILNLVLLDGKGSALAALSLK
jgi:hypothetical protein